MWPVGGLSDPRSRLLRISVFNTIVLASERTFWNVFREKLLKHDLKTRTGTGPAERLSRDPASRHRSENRHRGSGEGGSGNKLAAFRGPWMYDRFHSDTATVASRQRERLHRRVSFSRTTPQSRLAVIDGRRSSRLKHCISPLLKQIYILFFSLLPFSQSSKTSSYFVAPVPVPLARRAREPRRRNPYVACAGETRPSGREKNTPENTKNLRKKTSKT